MPDFIVGSPVRGEDFWFRKSFIDDLWESLRKHNVLLLAPRRIGKTSVMYKMIDEPEPGWFVIHLNVEDVDNPNDFFINLVDALNEYHPKFLRKILSAASGILKGMLAQIERIDAWELKFYLRKTFGKEKNWQGKLQELFDSVLKSNNKVLFIVDELPDMLNNINKTLPEEYEKFLHWFRKIRTRSLDGNVRWLVGGSVNLVAALDQQGKVKLINDLKTEPLSPFTHAEVEEYVTKMFSQRKLLYDQSVIHRIWELLGAPIPVFLQMLTQEIHRVWKRDQTKTITATDVTDIFNKALLGEMARDKLQHFRSRIFLYYPTEEQEAALYLLNKLSQCENGIENNTLFSLYRTVQEQKTSSKKGAALHQAFQGLLMNLRSDFYIEELKNGKYDFASHLLKTWWKKYYGFEA